MVTVELRRRPGGCGLDDPGDEEVPGGLNARWESFVDGAVDVDGERQRSRRVTDRRANPAAVSTDG